MKSYCMICILCLRPLKKMETPIKNNSFKIPPGYILIHKRWKDSYIYGEIKRKFNNIISQDLGYTDFYLAEDRHVIYIPESVLLTYVKYDNYSDYSKHETVIIADRNTVTADQYAKLQDEFVIKLGFTLYPIGNVSELPELVYHLSVVESMKTPNNQFKRKSLTASSDLQMNMLMNIPDLGKTKAEKLINKFNTVHKIALSSVEDLTPIVGVTSANKIYKYFNDVGIG